MIIVSFTYHSGQIDKFGSPRRAEHVWIVINQSRKHHGEARLMTTVCLADA